MNYGISPNLKIAEKTEIEILKQETLEELFESKYESEDKIFLKLINKYTNYKGDETLKEIILKIYDFMQSTPVPKEWLQEKIELFSTKETSFEKTIWGKILYKQAKEELQDCILKLEGETNQIRGEIDTEKFIAMLSEDVRKLKEIYAAVSWDDLYEKIEQLKLDRFPVDKKVPEEIKNRIKETRKKVKDILKITKEKGLIYPSEQAFSEIEKMYHILKDVGMLTLEFAENFLRRKQEKNMMDFSDIEHFALEILKKEEGKVSEKYQQKFEEILIDEYQDSNLVQESILSAIARGNNTFMVGDVKQSIYKFRQARPELFLEKYETYCDNTKLQVGDNLKIQLFKNFRSRKHILHFTNILFDSIMSKKLGDIDYTESEYLNLGAEYVEADNLNTEIYIIDVKEKEETIYQEEEDKHEEEIIEDVLVEAKLVAKKIKELVETGFLITDKNKAKRRVTYKDIAVLLRTTKSLAPIYEQEMTKLHIPVFCDTTMRIFRFY